VIILIWSKSFFSSMAGNDLLLAVLWRLIFERPLTLFSGFSWGISFGSLASQKDLFILLCSVSTTFFFVVVNGDLHGFFYRRSGVQQRDPLSPYLFICCMEYFSMMLKLASRQPRFCFHLKCGVQGINLLIFANDVLLLSREDCNNSASFNWNIHHL